MTWVSASRTNRSTISALPSRWVGRQSVQGLLSGRLDQQEQGVLPPSRLKCRAL
jgi:hypothetical protein